MRLRSEADGVRLRGEGGARLRCEEEDEEAEE